MKKKILSMIILSALVLNMTGCGANTDAPAVTTLPETTSAGTTTAALLTEATTTAETEPDGREKLKANAIYYDAGTMLLNAYYNAETYEVTNNNYEEMWHTREVVSYLTDSTITIPSTTDINNGNSKVMQSWEEYSDGTKQYVADTTLPDYGVHSAIWGVEDANGDGVVDENDKGMIYNYVAKGESYESGGEILIDWNIKAWPAFNNDTNTYNFITKDTLNTTAKISEEWKTGAIFEENAPKWISGNTRYEDWQNNPNPLFIGYGTTTSCWAIIKTIPYGSAMNAMGVGGMLVAHVGYPDPTDPNASSVPFRLFSESPESANKNGMAIYEHVCSQIAAGQPCTHTYDELANATGTVPIYSIGSMLSLCWSETKDFLYDAYKAGNGDFDCDGRSVKLTSFRLYDLNIQPRIDSEDVDTDFSNYVRAYDDGVMIENLHATFKGDFGSTSATDIAKRISISDRYNSYVEYGVKADDATLVNEDLLNTQHEFYYAVSLVYDLSDDYTRSGGHITGK